MALQFLYKTFIGRVILKALTRPAVSVAVGRFLDTKFSCFLINPFVKKNRIDLSVCEVTQYNSFNSFFCRKVKEEYRPVCAEQNLVISPCDGLLSVYTIKDNLVIPVKQSRYYISDLIRDNSLAKEFDGGLCLVFRLCVDHYHRYAYIESGVKNLNVRIDGILHTVQPVALRDIPVFTENSREYTLIETSDCGKILQMEVGAMLVGRIDNYHGACECVRGQEKGRFLYGGSTIIVLIQKDQVNYPEELIDATKNSIETPVLLGQSIMTKQKKNLSN